jgi:hypothetical protein
MHQVIDNGTGGFVFFFPCSIGSGSLGLGNCTQERPGQEKSGQHILHINSLVGANLVDTTTLKLVKRMGGKEYRTIE